MKRFLLASLLVVAVSASLLEEPALFVAFKAKHGKTYMNQAEETKRFNIFKNNVQAINEHNALYDQGLVSYNLAVNKFSDMTSAEFSAMLTLQKSTRPQYNITKTFKLAEGVEVPSSIDWREKNVVTPVKNQLTCESCWAFSITGSTEGAYALKTGNLVSLSEQQLVDCTTNINLGCHGGYLEDTFPYVSSNGLVSENSYPYQAVDSSCKYKADDVVTRIDSFVTIYGDEKELANAVGTVGPVSIAIDASYFQSYNQGIFHSNYCSNYSLNHGVLAVGYGSENGVDFWIVKNSWGGDWGDSGYIKIRRGTNECGIADDTVYPVIN